MKQTLSDLCSFADGRVAIDVLDLDTYVSTENMLPNKDGINRSAGLPTVSQTQAYKPEDVLVSNIRPYFRKIWIADRSGGCSNDVLVLRAKENCYPGFLYSYCRMIISLTTLLLRRKARRCREATKARLCGMKSRTCRFN